MPTTIKIYSIFLFKFFPKVVLQKFIKNKLRRNIFLNLNCHLTSKVSSSSPLFDFTVLTSFVLFTGIVRISCVEAGLRKMCAMHVMNARHENI